MKLAKAGSQASGHVKAGANLRCERGRWSEAAPGLRGSAGWKSLGWMVDEEFCEDGFFIQIEIYRDMNHIIY